MDQNENAWIELQKLIDSLLSENEALRIENERLKLLLFPTIAESKRDNHNTETY